MHYGAFVRTRKIYFETFNNNLLFVPKMMLIIKNLFWMQGNDVCYVFIEIRLGLFWGIHLTLSKGVDMSLHFWTLMHSLNSK